MGFQRAPICTFLSVGRRPKPSNSFLIFGTYWLFRRFLRLLLILIHQLSRKSDGGSWLLLLHKCIEIRVYFFCRPLLLDDSVVLWSFSVLLHQLDVLSLDLQWLLLTPFLSKLDADLLDFFSSLGFGFWGFGLTAALRLWSSRLSEVRWFFASTSAPSFIQFRQPEISDCSFPLILLLVWDIPFWPIRAHCVGHRLYPYFVSWDVNLPPRHWRLGNRWDCQRNQGISYRSRQIMPNY